MPLFASLHLLHLLSSTLPGSSARFFDAFRALTAHASPTDIYAAAKQRTSRIPHFHPHLRLAKRAFEALHRRSWVAFRKLYDDNMDHKQALLLRALESRVREVAWQTLSLSYQMLPDHWTRQQLACDQKGSPTLLSYLETKDCADQWANGTIQVRLGRWKQTRQVQ